MEEVVIVLATGRTAASIAVVLEDHNITVKCSECGRERDVPERDRIAMIEELGYRFAEFLYHNVHGTFYGGIRKFNREHVL